SAASVGAAGVAAVVVLVSVRFAAVELADANGKGSNSGGSIATASDFGRDGMSGEFSSGVGSAVLAAVGDCVNVLFAASCSVVVIDATGSVRLVEFDSLSFKLPRSTEIWRGEAIVSITTTAASNNANAAA